MPALCALGCATAAIAGSGPRHGQTAPPRKRGADLPGSVTGKGLHVVWYDRQSASGPLVTSMVADARAGSLTRSAGGGDSRLSDARAVLYRHGRPEATIQAPVLFADERSPTVTGTGGVTVVSIADPRDTTLHADRVVWDRRTGILTATGHAVVIRRVPGKPPQTAAGAVIVYNISSRHISVR